MFERLKRIIIRYIDAITGKFVTKQYAEDNPATTVKERRKVDVKEPVEKPVVKEKVEDKPKRKYTKRKTSAE